MKKLLSAPVKMNLSDSDNLLYQSVLKQLTSLSLNLLAVKTDEIATDFFHWNRVLLDICLHQLDFDLLEQKQYPELIACIEQLHKNCLIGQLKMLRVVPWPIFASEVQARSGWVESRLALLKKSKSLFLCGLQNASTPQQNALIGKPTSDWQALALPSFKNSRLFAQYISLARDVLDQALTLIPLNGEVKRSDYDAFIDRYKHSYCQTTGAKTAPLYPITRILALYRPDIFVCIGAIESDLIAAAFNSDRLAPDAYSVYWEQVIETIQNTAFWRATQPNDESEIEIWQHRVALIDIFMQAEFLTATDNNYYKAVQATQNDPKKRTAKIPKVRKKLTPEELVDQALASPDVSEFVKSQRDAVLSQVKNGKKVDQVIAMMQSIFS
ncbi:hypothetical protein [Gayadomonas joobiniege]|uniref:hypothetical protein n=1 Tax=Gayadomonas joobiniege TaxID=1234606 RepID=UPI00035C4FD8|nr:hypothetical protein [Gayadomonas joobiniege]